MDVAVDADRTGLTAIYHLQGCAPAQDALRTLRNAPSPLLDGTTSLDGLIGVSQPLVKAERRRAVAASGESSPTRLDNRIEQFMLNNQDVVVIGKIGLLVAL